MKVLQKVSIYTEISALIKLTVTLMSQKVSKVHQMWIVIK